MSNVEVKKDEHGIYTMFVDSEPFFLRAGELHNSAAASLDWMEEKIWPNLRGLNMNSLIVPIYWEEIEPEEGRFDFSLMDGVIEQAAREGMRLVFLWFGLWKNAESMYVPSWVKNDSDRFFLVEKCNGEKINTVSPLCSAAVSADKKAFARVMEHIREVDEDRATVITIQVENEIGVMGTDRDYGEAAEKAFNDLVPENISRLFDRVGTWMDVFGDNAQECFMAYYFAKAVEEIAGEGKKAYNIPMYANCWLRQYPWYPGSYPSGGPVKEVHKIWKEMAPSLFALAPDIYVPYCADVMDEYSYEENPLFIPEIRKDAVASSYYMYAFLHHNAICFSPFGIEELALRPEEIDKPPMEIMIALNIDPSAFDIAGSKEVLSATYKLMENVEPLYLRMRGTDKLKSYVRHGENDYGCFVRYEDYDFLYSYSPRMSGKPLGCVSFFELEPNKFLVIGMEGSLEVKCKPNEAKKANFQRLESGTVENGNWICHRNLNGDERMAIKFGSMPTAYMMELYKY